MTRVLIVDDEPIICDLIESLIDCAALEIELCPSQTSGEMAYQYALREHPQILITDINMPGMDGLELVRRLSEADPSIKYIIISGYQSFEYAYTAIKYGVADFLLKPIDRTELNRTLANIIDTNRLSEHLTRRIEEVSQNMSSSRQSIRRQLLENLSLSGTLPLSAKKRFEKFQEYYNLTGDSMRIGILQTDMQPGSFPLADRLLPRIWDRFSTIFSPICEDTECSFEDNSFLFFLNYSSEREDKLNMCIQSALQMAMEESYDYRISLVIAMSEPFADLSHITAAYRRAYCAMQSRFVLGTNRIINATEINITNEQFIAFEKYREPMRHSIDILDDNSLFETVDLLIGDMHAYLRSYPYQTYTLYVQILRDISTVFLRVRDDMQTAGADFFRKRLRECQSLADFDHMLCLLIQDMYNKYRDESFRNQNRTVSLVKHYIDEHYAEPLTLDILAARVYVNSAYLGILFKKCEGIGFTDYLAQLRMEKAKVLLRDTDASIAVIAQDVGYKDTRYFIKQFTTKVGIKPTEYRKIHSV